MKPFRGIYIVLSALAGAALGFVVLHPYSMMVYYLHERHELRERGIDTGSLTPGIAESFDPEMLEMGIPFALLGMAAGLFFGFWLRSEHRKKEMEKKAVAMETLRQLMVTLSHYLLNATTVIGGYSARLTGKTADPDFQRDLAVIQEESREIESVVKSLQSLDEIRVEGYTAGGTSMIDIQKELSEKVERSGAMVEQTKEGH